MVEPAIVRVHPSANFVCRHLLLLSSGLIQVKMVL